jgi:hypothetical protein
MTRDLDIEGTGNMALFWLRIYDGHASGLAANTRCDIGLSDAQSGRCGRVYQSPSVGPSGSRELSGTEKLIVPGHS